VVEWLETRCSDWELLLTVLSEGHSAGEQLWHGIDPDHPLAGCPSARGAGVALREVYRTIDKTVGRIARSLPPETVLVAASLHGVGTNVADVLSMALLPELLYRWQLGRTGLRAPVDPEAWRRRGCPALDADPALHWLDHVRRFWAEGEPTVRPELPEPGLAGAWRRLRRRRPPAPEAERGPPGPLGEPIAPETSRTPAQIGVPSSEIRSQPTVWYREAWPHLRVFALPTFYDGRVRVNLAGRERRGIVPRSEYVRVCREVEALLRACRDVRTGRPVVEEVRWMRGHDPMDVEECDADLVVTWAVASDAIEHPELGVVGPLPFRRTGGHSERGLLLAAGPGIAAADLPERSARDVTPTVLRLLGRRAPPGVEGSPLPAPALGLG